MNYFAWRFGGYKKALACDEAANANGGETADRARRESALEAALAYLEREGDVPVRRNRFAKNWALKNGAKRRAVRGEDEAPSVTLEKHDKVHHPEGYNPETDTCKLREQFEEVDRGDVISPTQGQTSGAVSAPQQAKVYAGLSNKRVKEYRARMEKKHPELDADLILTELGKIGDKTVQGDAFAWVMKGAVKLPEDLYKVEQARELAGKAKRDPLSWDTPQACINELLGEGHKVKEKPITVDDLKKNPLMSDYRDEGYGVETFQVDDSREGQKLMRQVINTHWGKDANPWCLLHGDGEGNLSDGSNGGYDAWNYWNHYNALPKRVAFKDGKLLAFMGTDGSDPEDITPEAYSHWEECERDESGDFKSFGDWMSKHYPDIQVYSEQWWDRQDKPHEGIPVSGVSVPYDRLGRKYKDAEIVGGNIKAGDSNTYIGKDGSDGYREWFGESDKVHREIKDGWDTYYDGDGNKEFVSRGKEEMHFYDGGDQPHYYINDDCEVEFHKGSEEPRTMTFTENENGDKIEIAFHTGMKPLYMKLKRKRGLDQTIPQAEMGQYMERLSGKIDAAMRASRDFVSRYRARQS